MIDVKLEDFENYRDKLYIYASNLLKGRGFVEKDGELKEFSNDIIQNVYLKFHTYGLNAYVNEAHLFSSLKTFVYREFLNTIDGNRRGAYYILKKDSIESNYKEEFKQFNIREFVKPTQDQFDIFDKFSEFLDDDEALILNRLIDGFSQVELAKELSISIDKVNDCVRAIKLKYIKFDPSSYIPILNKDVTIVSQKAIYQLSLSGDVIKEWSKTINAADELNLSASGITACCKGRRLTHGGFKWKYKKANENTDSKMQ